MKRKLMGRMLNKNVFPSLQRRGGRAIEKMMPKATKVGADGVVSPISKVLAPVAPQSKYCRERAAGQDLVAVFRNVRTRSRFVAVRVRLDRHRTRW